MQERILTVRRSFPNKQKTTIATLSKKKPHNTIQDEKYILKVTIPEPSLDKVNAYLGCSNCGKGTNTPAGNIYSCTNCSTCDAISSPRVTLNCQVTDGTGNLAITAFTTNAEKILRMQAPDIFRMKHTEDNATFESIRNLLKTSPITIEVGPTTTLAINNVLQWALKDVENNYLQNPTEAAESAKEKEAMDLAEHNNSHKNSSESTECSNNTHKHDISNKARMTEKATAITNAPASPQEQPETEILTTEKDTQKLIQIKIEGAKKANPNVTAPNTEGSNPNNQRKITSPNT
ncbi:uncharacterized protein LOC141612511 [Silene latifolia]|uniref:uncharacterized protein LOC141612511 n=1 Tax=Silene latifolia TaxID=37657 RepID=UPI003D77EA79